MYVFGGYGDKGVRLNDLHQFDLPTRTWVAHPERQGQGESPSARHSAAMVADTAQLSLWLFGGTTSDGPSDDLFRYDLTTKRWHLITAEQGVPQPSAADDGDDGNEDGGETPPPWPSQRWGHALAFCPRRSKIFLFGGKTMPGTAAVTNDLWSFDTGALRRQLLLLPCVSLNRIYLSVSLCILMCHMYVCGLSCIHVLCGTSAHRRRARGRQPLH